MISSPRRGDRPKVAIGYRVEIWTHPGLRMAPSSGRCHRYDVIPGPTATSRPALSERASEGRMKCRQSANPRSRAPVLSAKIKTTTPAIAVLLSRAKFQAERRRSRLPIVSPAVCKQMQHSELSLWQIHHRRALATMRRCDHTGRTSSLTHQVIIPQQR